MPEPREAECRRFYEAHPALFTAGELAAVRHIRTSAPRRRRSCSKNHPLEKFAAALAADGRAHRKGKILLA